MTCGLHEELLFVEGYHENVTAPVVRVLGYRSGGPSSILGTTRKKKK
jgi:hypothetical protein